MVERAVKANGFACPLHPFQVIAWIVVLLDTYAFYFITIVAFSYSPTFCSLVGIAYTVTFAVVIYYGAKATGSDPTDPSLEAQKKCKAEK